MFEHLLLEGAECWRGSGGGSPPEKLQPLCGDAASYMYLAVLSRGNFELSKGDPKFCLVVLGRFGLNWARGAFLSGRSRRDPSDGVIKSRFRAFSARFVRKSEQSKI